MDVSAYLNVPYGGDKFCRTFAAMVLADQGVPVPAVERPEDAADWVQVEIPNPGDIVVFRRGRRPNHMGVCIGRGRFLHVEEGCRSCIERLSSPLWNRRIVGFYRFTGERIS